MRGLFRRVRPSSRLDFGSLLFRAEAWSRAMGKDSSDLFGALFDAQKVNRVVPVLVPLPVPEAYSYAVPEGMAVEPGSVVQVPLGPRQVIGVVWDGTDDVRLDPKKLRPITLAFDCPPLTREMRAFIDWVSAYTLSPPGLVARMAVRAPAALDPEPMVEALRYRGGEPERLTPARARVLDLTRDEMPWTRSGLAHAAGVSASVIDGLVKQGLFDTVFLPPPPVVALPDPDYVEPRIEGPQKQAASEIVENMQAGGFSASLIDGVTGSGKTEVYFEAIAEALRKGRQVLILLPEIALTASFLERFQDRFGAKPAEWHSDLSPRLREKVWRGVVTGEVRVVAGARSALFLPFEELGLIVVDEEHDPAYKQEDRVFYNARDMAVVRGRIGDFPVVLVSATPSVESQVNGQSGRYHMVHLPTRFGEAAMPDLHLVDMRRHPPDRGGFLSPVLLRAVKKTVENGHQALLFLNRRGYAPLTLCRVCGHRFQCPQCSSWLVEHRFKGQIQCHQCGYAEKTPEACPECGTFDHLVACGPGVERIAEEVEKHFPDARTIVMSSDLLGGVKRLRLELEAIAKGEADIVIGTQLVAKGHNFPLMTLVGIVDADLGLANGDPRAAERTFQLLSQVTGRAGRTGLKSHGLLQTYQPQHPVMQAIVSGDPSAFYEREIGEREKALLPPFGRLASIIVSADARADAEGHARGLRAAAPRVSGIAVLGPAEAPLALVRGRHRFRLLVHGRRNSDMQAYLRQMLANGPKVRGSVHVQLDIDPQSFL
jgi:primosomal protein N' (replication factor Y) (superfamily II helicase)